MIEPQVLYWSLKKPDHTVADCIAGHEAVARLLSTHWGGGEVTGQVK